MTVVLMATGAAAWLTARLGWALAGAAHRSSERRAAAGRREDRRSASR